MVNTSMHEHKSNTFLLLKLSKYITKLNTSNGARNNATVKSIIKELKLRVLSPIQRQQYNRMVDRYSWI